MFTKGKELADAPNGVENSNINDGAIDAVTTDEVILAGYAAQSPGSSTRLLAPAPPHRQQAASSTPSRTGTNNTAWHALKPGSRSTTVTGIQPHLLRRRSLLPSPPRMLRPLAAAVVTVACLASSLSLPVDNPEEYMYTLGGAANLGGQENR